MSITIRVYPPSQKTPGLPVGLHNSRKRQRLSTDRGVIIMIALWILTIVSLLSLGLGHRVAVNLKLTKLQKDTLKSFYIAKAGIQKVTSILKSDSTPDLDMLNELWSRGYSKEFKDGPYIFKEGTVHDGIFTVKYLYGDSGNPEDYFYGASDEEQKLNINTASFDILNAFFTALNADGPAALANNICYWRGDAFEDTDPYYESIEAPYPARRKPFKTLEELSLVKGFSGKQDLIEQCRKFLTVYTDGSVNINTVSPFILEIIFSGLKAQDAGLLPAALTYLVMDVRNGTDNTVATDDDVAIVTIEELKDILTAGIGLLPGVAEWIDTVTDFPFTVASDLFRIEIEAAVKTGAATKHVTAIAKRSQGCSIVYWNET